MAGVSATLAKVVKDVVIGPGFPHLDTFLAKDNPAVAFPHVADIIMFEPGGCGQNIIGFLGRGGKEKILNLTFRTLFL
ncbi:MAG: hypothetical protein A2277_20340 [Desulfobacterales bacterium RIFOXYA12_FULL_46_15]|nr:MAG: hypothetical protein A2277_20340 [Desulfobacterales bacterium RIFOXYA12_FULL_46_15]